MVYGKVAGFSQALPQKETISMRYVSILIIAIVLTAGLLMPAHKSFAELTQKSSLAGSFYPEDAEELKRQVDGFINNAKPDTVKGGILAIVSPHAGYRYSGPVAGYGFKALKGKGFNTAIIIGPSHRHYFDGIAVLDKDSYDTPLGRVEIDKDMTKKLISFSKNINYYIRPFLNENSIETQIPFVQAALPEAKLVLVLTGSPSYDTCTLLRDSLFSVIGERRDTVIIASTDMSHYNPDNIARIIDRSVIEELERFNPEELFLELSGMPGKDRPCGSTAVIGTIMAARKLGADKIDMLRYATSGDVTGDYTAVVGYMSAVIYKSSNDNSRITKKDDTEKNMENLLNEDQKERLLKLARDTLTTYVNTGRRLDITEDDSALNKEMGVFVTLHKRGMLRGCIGNIVGNKPLYMSVRDMAIQAGTQDPRFASVKPEELNEIDIEISVLSPLEKINNPDKIVMGKHGVIVRDGFRSGVYLPQVAAETGWSRDEFMDSLCAHKAGMAKSAWRNGGCDIYVFSAEVFGEEASE